MLKKRKNQVNQSLLGLDIPFWNKFKGFEYGIIHSQWLGISLIQQYYLIGKKAILRFKCTLFRKRAS